MGSDKIGAKIIQQFQHICQDVSATEILARKLSRVSMADDTFLLFGQIGSGKSVFSRAFIKTRMDPFNPNIDVPSPSYTLVQSYQAGDTQILHADLYRLKTEGEIVELPLFDTVGKVIRLIEWPELLKSIQLNDVTRIEFGYVLDSPNTRILKIMPGNNRIKQLLMTNE